MSDLFSPKPVVEKIFAQEARDLLKLMDKFVQLKQTHPSMYDTYHEVVRKFLEEFKK